MMTVATDMHLMLYDSKNCSNLTTLIARNLTNLYAN